MKCLVPLAAGIAVYCQAVSFLAPTRAFGRGSVGPMSIAGLAVADFNGDGKLDIVDIPGNRSGLSFPLLSLGNGDGTFRANVGSVGLASGLSSPVTADFDLDGRMDVATFSSSGLAVFLGNGDGTLRSPIFSAYLEAPRVPPLTADFNGDGKADVMLGKVLYLGNGDGSFASRVALDGNGRLTADFNRDGRTDVLVALPAGELTVALGMGDGTFRATPPFAPLFPGGNLLAADFTGDGVVDVAMDSSLSGGPVPMRVAVFPGRGDGSFMAAVVTEGAPGPIFASADLNRDGRVDLLALNSVMPGNGRGSFGVPVLFGVTGSVCFSDSSITFLCGPVYEAFVIGDINGDGRTDVVCSSRFRSGSAGIGYAVSVILNNGQGDGLLVPGVSAATGRGPVSVGSMATAYGENLAPIGIGGSLAAPPLPHHRTCGSASGGSAG